MLTTPADSNSTVTDDRAVPNSALGGQNARSPSIAGDDQTAQAPEIGPAGQRTAIKQPSAAAPEPVRCELTDLGRQALAAPFDEAMDALIAMLQSIERITSVAYTVEMDTDLAAIAKHHGVVMAALRMGRGRALERHASRREAERRIVDHEGTEWYVRGGAAWCLWPGRGEAFRRPEVTVHALCALLLLVDDPRRWEVEVGGALYRIDGTMLKRHEDDGDLWVHVLRVSTDREASADFARMLCALFDADARKVTR